MKKIKILILVFLLLLLSGCSVESNLVMNEYGNVTENIIMNESIFNLGRSKSSAKEIIDSTLDKYKIALNSRGYKYDTQINSKDAKISITNEYDNIMDYFESTVFSQYVYKQMKWEDIGEYYEINNVTEHIIYCGDCSDWPALPSIKVSITLPVAATENDADKVEGYTYTWLYNETTPASKTFHLKIDKNLLKENEIKLEKNRKTKDNLNVALKIFCVFVIIAIFVMLIMYLIKRYKENKIEY